MGAVNGLHISSSGRLFVTGGNDQLVKVRAPAPGAGGWGRGLGAGGGGCSRTDRFASHVHSLA